MIVKNEECLSCHMIITIVRDSGKDEGRSYLVEILCRLTYTALNQNSASSSERRPAAVKSAIKTRSARRRRGLWEFGARQKARIQSNSRDMRISAANARIWIVRGGYSSTKRSHETILEKQVP